MARPGALRLAVPVLALPVLAFGGCAAPAGPDPRDGEVPLDGAAAGWDAYLLLDQGETGIWTVAAVPFFEQYGAPEVVALDDRGRVRVLVSYSGKWTPLSILEEGAWLGALAHGDVDPRIEGAELYVGGEKGNLYQVVPYLHGALDARLIAHIPGRELHTALVVPGAQGSDLLVFTRPGELFLVAATGPHGTFETRSLGALAGRVRDALVLPPREGGAPVELVTASRTGRVELLTLGPAGPRWSTIHAAAVGAGRLALAPAEIRGATVVYSTLDDGRVLRHERAPDGAWSSATIHVGTQGPRGLATGRLDDDPDTETVALFGYSGVVELLVGTVEGWSATALFTDRDRGHWLSAAEIDGRNDTRELLGSGYGGRVFLLTRP